MIARARPRSPRLFICAFAVTAVLAGCGRDDSSAAPASTPPASESSVPAAGTLRVVEVDLGRSVDANFRIADDTDDFSPSDTIYASVATEGTQSGATLVARWSFQDGQIVDETSQTISPTGPANTEFHISMPTGLPTGQYTVEILLNGQSVARETFEVD